MVINRGEYAAAPHEFMRWVHGGGRILPGLIARRRAEVALYNSVG
jgi:lysozyme